MTVMPARALEPDSTMAFNLRVEPVNDADAAEWDRFVAGTPEAGAYHGYAWRNVIRSVFGHQTYYLGARQDGVLAGVLPLVRLRSRLFGDFLVSLPYFNYGGVLAQGPALGALLADAEQLGQSLGVSHIELRHRTGEGRPWPARTDKVAMLLRLPATPEALLKNLPSKLRSQARRPIREGAESVFGGLELLDAFYAVFAENMRDLGTPVYPKAFFRTILTTFPDRTCLTVVQLHGRPVAAAFLIEHRKTMEIPWASSLRRVNNLGVNMYMYWKVLERAVSRGMEVFDFGRSTADGGTFRFKKQWGAQAEQLHWHYWLKDGVDLPRLNPSNPRFRLAVAAWQKLPLPVANWLGPHLVKNLP